LLNDTQIDGLILNICFCYIYLNLGVCNGDNEIANFCEGECPETGDQSIPQFL
jgi:hypothetical protein